MNSEPAVDVLSLTYRYGARVALDDVSLAVNVGEIFAFLGPNGSGKTTLFRILSSLVPAQHGKVEVFQHSMDGQLFLVRQLIGVVFQSPSLDKKLTVRENIDTQAALYGLKGRLLANRREEVLEQLGLTDRAEDIVETLSGGLKRRVDLAKSLIHRPRLLLMDEPSTGLDPGARSDLWRYLRHLRDQFQTTIVLTSHLLEEAERADRIAILHAGRLVALGDPSILRSSLGANSIIVETDDPDWVCEQLKLRHHCDAKVVDGDVRFGGQQAANWVAGLVEEFPNHVRSVRIGRPSLEDVFIEKTGHRFWHEPGGVSVARPTKR